MNAFVYAKGYRVDFPSDNMGQQDFAVRCTWDNAGGNLLSISDISKPEFRETVWQWAAQGYPTFIPYNPGAAQ